MLVESIEEAIKKKESEGGDDVEHISLPVLRMDCHHHLRNVWIGALNKHLSKYLNKILQSDLDFKYLGTFTLLL